jgi:hypothetical protein
MYFAIIIITCKLKLTPYNNTHNLVLQVNRGYCSNVPQYGSEKMVTLLRSLTTLHTLQSLIHTASSPFTTPCFLALWKSQNVRTHCQKYRIFMTSKNPGHLASRTELYGTSGQSTLK